VSVAVSAGQEKGNVVADFDKLRRRTARIMWTAGLGVALAVDGLARSENLAVVYDTSTDQGLETVARRRQDQGGELDRPPAVALVRVD
jgi:hypothetical protein